MDNSVDDSSNSWSTPLAAAIALCVGGVILLVAAFFAASDAAGTVLMGVAGVLLIAFGTYALVIRPRLAVRVEPTPLLSIRTLGGLRSYPPDRVHRIRLLSVRRIGRSAGQLEIDVLDDPDAADPNTADPDTADPDAIDPDAGHVDDEPETRLIVLSRWDLGTDLLSVVDALRVAGFPVDDARH